MSAVHPTPSLLVPPSDVLTICQQVAVPNSAIDACRRMQLLTTALHRLVKHFHGAHAGLVDALCDEVSRSLQLTDIKTTEIAGVLWSIGMVGPGPSRTGLLNALRPAIIPLLKEASSSQLSNVACAIAKLDLDWHDEVREVLSQCRDRLGVQETPAGVVSNMCWAAARSGVRDDAFLNEAAATWLSRDPALVPPSATAMLFWSLGKLAPDEPYVTDLFSTARGHPQLTADFGLRECSSFLCGYAYVATTAPYEGIFKVAMASLKGGPRSHPSTQTITNCCWASATLAKHHESIKSSASCLVGSLVALVLNLQIDAFSPQEVSNILWSAAQLLGKGNVVDLAKFLLPHTPEQILAYTAQDLAVCMAALTQADSLGDFESPFVKCALQRIEQSIFDWPPDATHIHAVGQLAWSIAGRPLGEITPLVEWATANPVNAEAFVKVLWCTASTPEAQQGSLWDSRELALFLDGFTEKHLSESSHFKQQELALITWSLATLRISHQMLEEHCCHRAKDLLLTSGITSSHLSMLLWGLASNYHTSAPASELIQEVVARVRSRELRFAAADSFHVVWSLAAFDVFDPQSLEVLLSAAATFELDGAALQKINQVSMWSSSHGYEPTPMIVELFHRAAGSAQRDASVIDSVFQDQVTTCLRRSIGNSDYEYRVVSEMDLTNLGCPGVIVDLAVTRCESADECSRDEELPLIIEVDGPWHYVRSIGTSLPPGQKLCGKAVLRRNALRRLGFHVEEISFAQWSRLGREERQKYIESILKGRLNAR